jgi:hypothetical protein
MTTGHPSKAALGAARIALLAGVSAVSLYFGMDTAQAQSAVVYYDSNISYLGQINGVGLVTVDNGVTQTGIGSYYSITGQVVGGLFAYDWTTANAVNITPDAVTVGNYSTGFVSTTLDQTGLTVTDGTNTATVTSTSVTANSGIFNSVNTGSLNVSGATTTNGITNSGNIDTTTLSVNGLASLNGGAVVTGNTTTDSLTVNQGASFASGAATIDGATGNIATTGSITSGTGINTTTINGNQAIITGAAGATYGLAVVGNTDAPGVVGVGVTGDQIGVAVVNGSGTATMSATAGGAPGFAATNAAGTTVMSGSGIAVSNASGSQFVATSGGYISAEGNRVQNVGTPILGTDATNKAYVDKGLNKAYEGTAIALAISQPVFLPGQTFAIRGGWGDYEGQNAFGVSAAGVIAHNVLGYGSTVSLDAGIGAGNSSVAGKAGVTVGFGGGSAPLK